MESCNGLTLDHINAFFSLSDEVQPINIVGTATGGAGIDNLHQYPPPKTKSPGWINAGTEYVQKYTEKDNFQASQLSLHMSSLSICTLDDVDDSSTIVDLPPAVSELDNETTQQIYATYFNVPNRTYDPNLSITNYREEIMKQLNISSVLIIQGPTGCGKTTQVPQYILDFYQSKGRYCNIAVTQPRKLAAMSIANRVCQERNWQLGTIVGYQVAMDRKTSTDTRLCYMTTGCLLEKLVNAKRMDMYTHVIIDEVHERNQDIDFALLLVKKFLRSNSQRVKVILMSATFESTDFAKYFAFSSLKEPAPIIEIFGKSQDVTEHYLHELKTLLPQKPPEYPDMNYPTIDPCLYECVSKLMCVFDRIEKCEQKVPSEQEYAPQRGAVLIFLPGYDEIAAMSNKLLENNFKRNYWIVPLHSTITVEEQRKVFQDAPRDHRKVIISTNIAESSITVPDIKYVIDFCLTKNLVTDMNTNYTCLQLEWASKANCIQRKGRAGRVDIGKVYRMVPKDFYDQLPDYADPEIKRCPLTSVVLHVKKLDLCEPQELLAFALDPPKLADIGNAVTQLKEALALTSTGNNPFDGDLTFVGRVMANLPLDIKLSKLIVFGYVFDCLEDCIIIAASLSLQSFFSRPFDKALDAYKSRLSWDEGACSDCITYLKAYKMWKDLCVQRVFKRPGGMKEEQWAVANFVQLRRIREVEKLVKEIKSRLEQFKISAEQQQPRDKKKKTDAQNDLILQVAIAGAFFPQYYVQEALDEVTVNRELNGNDPHSTVMLSGLPNHAILYASSLKEQLTCCAENMKIDFEGKKAYVRFDRNYSDNDTTVQRAVYLACKMRKLRLNVRLELFSNEEADRKMQQIMALRTSSKSGNTFAVSRITVNCNDGPLIKNDMDITFPPVRSVFSILITEVKNCGKFWARIVSNHTSQDINFLEVTINSNKGANLQPLSSAPKTNFLCLAPYQEPNGRKDYYRAVVQEIKPGHKAMVYFVDYGNVDVVSFSELRLISPATPDVLTTPPLAFECQLAEIKPSASGDAMGNWCPQAINWFKRTVSGFTLTAEVYSVVQGIPRLELRKTERDGITMSINKQLLKMGFAEMADESLASKKNHDLRVKCSGYESADVGPAEKDVEVSWNEAGSCTHMQRTGRTVRLHGPSNPCEVNYSGITNLDRFKQVKIDADSVNSVCINADPQDPYSRLLVSAGVAIRQNSQDLVARNTTLLPKKRGMASLLCMLFAPQAEIRTDKLKKRYVGALCGLGFNGDTGDALYPDHDIEIPFDVEVSLRDITSINGVRMGVNFLLDTGEVTNRSVSLSRERVRNNVIELLTTPFLPKEVEYFGRGGAWNQVPPDQLCQPEVSSVADNPDVLPLIKPPELTIFRE